MKVECISFDQRYTHGLEEERIALDKTQADMFFPKLNYSWSIFTNDRSRFYLFGKMFHQSLGGGIDAKVVLVFQSFARIPCSLCYIDVLIVPIERVVTQLNSYQGKHDDGKEQPQR